MELIFGITAAILAVIVVIIIVTHRYSDSDDMKDRRRFIKFLKAQKIKLSPKWYKYAVQLDKAHHTRIIKCFTIARELLISLDDALEAAVYISSEKKNYHIFINCSQILSNFNFFFLLLTAILHNKN